VQKVPSLRKGGLGENLPVDALKRRGGQEFSNIVRKRERPEGSSAKGKWKAAQSNLRRERARLLGTGRGEWGAGALQVDN